MKARTDWCVVLVKGALGSFLCLCGAASHGSFENELPVPKRVPAAAKGAPKLDPVERAIRRVLSDAIYKVKLQPWGKITDVQIQCTPGSDGAFQVNGTAMLSMPPRGDFHFSLTSHSNNGGWGTASVTSRRYECAPPLLRDEYGCSSPMGSDVEKLVTFSAKVPMELGENGPGKPYTFLTVQPILLWRGQDGKVDDFQRQVIKGKIVVICRTR